MLVNEMWKMWIMGDGPFTTDIDLPWQDAMSKDDTNRYYIGQRSGYKKLIPGLGVLKPDEVRLYIDACIRKHLENWKHLWKVYVIDYNPIHNYNTEDVVERDLMAEGEGESKVNDKSNSSVSSNATGTAASTAFNSDELKTTGQNQQNGESSSQSQAESTGTSKSKGTEKETTTTKRAGNIGVTTTQNMIMQEYEARKLNFFDMVFYDMDGDICLQVYDLCKIK